MVKGYIKISKETALSRLPEGEKISLTKMKFNCGKIPQTLDRTEIEQIINSAHSIYDANDFVKNLGHGFVVYLNESYYLI